MSDQDTLANAIADADTLSIFLNAPADRANPGHPAGTVTNRTGTTFPVLAAILAGFPLDGIGGGGGSGYAYTFEPGAPAASLGHLTPKVGQISATGYWSASKAAGSGMTWICIGTDGTGNPGVLIPDATYGVLLTGAGNSGQRGKYAPIIPAGGRVDIRALGIKCDGVVNNDQQVVTGTTGQKAQLYVVRDAAIAKGWRLTGGDMLIVDEPFDMQQARLDMPDMIWKSTNDFAAGANPDGDYYAAAAAVMLSCGFPSGVKRTTPFYVDVVVQGRHPFNHAPQTKETGLRIYEVSSSTAFIRARARYCQTDFEMFGDTEKVRADLSSIYCYRVLAAKQDGPETTLSAAVSIGQTVFNVADSRRMIAQLVLILEDDTANEEQVKIASVSGNTVTLAAPGFAKAHAAGARVHNPAFTPDTNRYLVNAQNAVIWYEEPENGETSGTVVFDCEGRDDPGDGTPAIRVGNGKKLILSGQIRAHNGQLCLLAYNSKNNGANTVIAQDLSFIHGYGTALDFQSIHRVGGFWEIKDWSARDAAGGNQRGPCVRIGSVWETGGAMFALTNIKSDTGVQIGNVYTENQLIGGVLTPVQIPRSPTNTTLRLSLEMGSSDPYPGDSSWIRRAIDWRFSNGLTIDGRSGVKGFIDIGAGVVRGVLLLAADFLPSGGLINWSDQAQCVIDFGEVHSEDLFTRAWMKPGARAWLTDYAGLASMNREGRWTINGQLMASTLALGAQASDINRTLKRQGLPVGRTDGLPVVASGTAANAAWTDFSGNQQIAVTEQAATGTFVSRVQALGGAAPNATYRSALDRLYFKIQEAGIYNLTAALIAMAGWDEVSSRLNMRLEIDSVLGFGVQRYSGTENTPTYPYSGFARPAGMTWTAGRGYTSNGAGGGHPGTAGSQTDSGPLMLLRRRDDSGFIDLTSAGVRAQASATAASIAASAFVLGGGASNGFDVTDTARWLALKARRGTSAQAKLCGDNTTSVVSPASEFPHWTGASVNPADANQQRIFDNGRFNATGARGSRTYMSGTDGPFPKDPAIPVFLGPSTTAIPGNVTNRETSFVSIHAALTDYQMEILYRAQAEYLRTIGTL